MYIKPQQIKSLFNTADNIKLSAQKPIVSSTVEIGKCPKCSAAVVQKEKGFFCTGQNCHFAIWKDDKLFTSLGKKVTAPVVKSLLKNKKVSLKDCTSRKTGKKYDCIVYVDFSGKYPKYNISFK